MEAVQQIFDDLKGRFVTPLAQTAFVLDPRVRGLLPPDVFTNATMGFNFEEAWQQALASALNAYFLRFFRHKAELEEAKWRFGDYNAVKLAFMECPALPQLSNLPGDGRMVVDVTAELLAQEAGTARL